MPWVKVPPANHPIFHAALPKDPRVETLKMFGGVAAKTNGRIFAGLFGRSTMVWLPEPDRAAALSLKGAAYFDPMGNGRIRSEKVMLPESMMQDPAELRRWVARAFNGAAALPAKATKTTGPREHAKPSPRKPARSAARLDRAAAKVPVGKRPIKKPSK